MVPLGNSNGAEGTPPTQWRIVITTNIGGLDLPILQWIIGALVSCLQQAPVPLYVTIEREA